MSTKLCDAEAKATNAPVPLIEGPEVPVVRPSAPLWQLAGPPQIPLMACEPSAATSIKTGKPSGVGVTVGFTAKVMMLDIPPPGALFTAWI